MTDLKEQITNELIKDYKKRYFEGIVDTIDNIQKSLVEVKIQTGQYPTMECFVYEILPEMKELNRKRFAKDLDK